MRLLVNSVNEAGEHLNQDRLDGQHGLRSSALLASRHIWRSTDHERA
jgi:hypothetical protein